MFSQLVNQQSVKRLYYLISEHYEAAEHIFHETLYVPCLMTAESITVSMIVCVFLFCAVPYDTWYDAKVAFPLVQLRSLRHASTQEDGKHPPAAGKRQIHARISRSESGRHALPCVYPLRTHFAHAPPLAYCCPYAWVVAQVETQPKRALDGAVVALTKLFYWMRISTNFLRKYSSCLFFISEWFISICRFSVFVFILSAAKILRHKTHLSLCSLLIVTLVKPKDKSDSS
jgi:hypothetical protein